jgi:hypothetical protein
MDDMASKSSTADATDTAAPVVAVTETAPVKAAAPKKAAVKKAAAPAGKKVAKPVKAAKTDAAAVKKSAAKTAKTPKAAVASKAPAEKKTGKAAKPADWPVKAADKPVAAAPADKPKRVKKEKVIRDSFTMPKADYEKIAALKQKCLANGVHVKKGELLRAGLMLLEAADVTLLLAAVSAVETVKTGRPGKS